MNIWDDIDTPEFDGYKISGGGQGNMVVCNYSIRKKLSSKQLSLQIPLDGKSQEISEILVLLRKLGIVIGDVINMKKLFECIGFVDGIKDGTRKETLLGLKVFLDTDTGIQLSHPTHTHKLEKFIDFVSKESCSFHTWLKSAQE